MIYILGDSFSFGWNFFEHKNPNRKKLLYSHLLAEKLNADYKNYSFVGSSNYRLVRLANTIDIKKDDIVIIQWSAFTRLEIGVPLNKVMPNDVVISYNMLDDLDVSNDSRKVAHMVEKTGDLYTRQIYPGVKQYELLRSPSFRNLCKEMLHYSTDKSYLEQMFKILFEATVNKLRGIGCKFLMFTAWDVQYTNTDFLNVPEYLFHTSNMLDELRYKDSEFKHRERDDFRYWNEEEHRRVSDILYNALREKYDIQ